MTTAYYMRCHPWDLEDEGIDAVLGRLAGEIGLDGISLPAVTGDIAQLRTAPSVCGRIFRARAAANFQPDAGHYTNSRLRLPAAAWMKTRNTLDRIANACEKQRLSLRASIGPLTGESLVERFAFAQTIDCFGDRPGNALCPSNPDVREYVASTVRDLSDNYPISAIVLEGMVPNHNFVGAGPITIHVGADIPLTVHALLAWCFCPSCCGRAQDAGVDSQAALRAAKDHITRGLMQASPPLAPKQALVPDDPAIKAYSGFRGRTIASLLKRVRSSTPLRLISRECDLTEALDLEEVLRACDAVAAHLFQGKLSDPRYQSVPAGRVEALVRICPPEICDAPAMVAATHEAAQRGFASIEFETFGVAPDPCLDWVRQAIRYARRETK